MTIRYRSRVKAIYRYDPTQHKFVSHNPGVSLSRTGKKILTELDQFELVLPNGSAVPAFVPAAWLGDIAVVYREIVPDDNKDYLTGFPHSGHGTSVFNYLAEHNPKAEFVVIDTASFRPFAQHNMQVCSKDYAGFTAVMEEVNLINYLW